MERPKDNVSPSVGIIAATFMISLSIVMGASCATLLKQINKLEESVDDVSYRLERIEQKLEERQAAQESEHSTVVYEPKLAEPEPFTIITSLGFKVSSYDPALDYWTLMADSVRRAKEEDDPQSLSMGELYQAYYNIQRHEQGEELITYFDGDYTLDELYDIFFPDSSPYLEYTEDELIWVASTVHREAGSGFVTDDHQRAVASVVVNRVTNHTDWSFKQQNTIAEVLLAKGQYVPYLPTEYDERSLENARYVLENGPINDGLFQDSKIHGEIVAVYSYDCWPTTTYICK